MEPVRAAFDGGAGRDRQSVRKCAERLVVAAHNAYTMWPLERYRSGHTGTDSKKVGANAHVGSNPTLSANYSSILVRSNPLSRCFIALQCRYCVWQGVVTSNC